MRTSDVRDDPVVGWYVQDNTLYLVQRQVRGNRYDVMMATLSPASRDGYQEDS